MKIKLKFSVILLNVITLSACAQNIAPKAFKFAGQQTRLLLTETAKAKTALNNPGLQRN